MNRLTKLGQLTRHCRCYISRIEPEFAYLGYEKPEKRRNQRIRRGQLQPSGNSRLRNDVLRRCTRKRFRVSSIEDRMRVNFAAEKIADDGNVLERSRVQACSVVVKEVVALWRNVFVRHCGLDTPGMRRVIRSQKQPLYTNRADLQREIQSPFLIRTLAVLTIRRGYQEIVFRDFQSEIQRSDINVTRMVSEIYIRTVIPSVSIWSRFSCSMYAQTNYFYATWQR